MTDSDNFLSSFKKTASLVAVMLMLMAGQVSANAAYDDFLERAKAGDARYQMLMADAYSSGRVVEKNLAEAIKWFTRAAEQGERLAMHSLGEMYSVNHEILNYQKSYAWYEKASKEGDKYALQWTKSKGFLVFDWGVRMDEIALTIDARGVENLELRTQIGFSKGGEKRVYFVMLNLGRSACDEAGEVKDTVWVFRKKSVAMQSICHETESPTINVLSFTPRSERGLAFVVNLFKKSSKNIMIKINDSGEFPVSPMGFSKEWNKASDEVL